MVDSGAAAGVAVVVVVARDDRGDHQRELVEEVADLLGAAPPPISALYPRRGRRQRATLRPLARPEHTRRRAVPGVYLRRAAQGTLHRMAIKEGLRDPPGCRQTGTAPK